MHVLGLRITRPIETYFNAEQVGGTGRFSHYRPAAYLQREQGTLLAQIDEATVERAEEMFKVLNGLLP